ncbi:MAG: [Oscillospiraceae bacterium]|nr:[FeFe] hydrogenase H-cluster radical SAM maturase HydE [Oscillospiraceae bacterium]
MTNQERIDLLCRNHRLESAQWEALLTEATDADMEYAIHMAREIAVARYGKQLWFRGIVELSNYCKNDCYYCGIRCSNRKVSRYRLTPEDILNCCEEGYRAGFRTFVLQGGEDGWFTDERVCGIIRSIKERYPDCAVTLSLGERSRESYQVMFDAGADRYLLRHETADEDHYAVLHPAHQTLSNRLRCLRDLKDIGYQTGCGIMVGSPGQTPQTLVKDMLFMQEFKPQMIGIGPFLPHGDTPFRQEQPGSVSLTLYLLALCRIMLPSVLLPATTALGTAEQDGRKQGVLAGCNVVMPNLSPASVRKKYMLYDNKAGTDQTAAEGIASLRRQMEDIGYEVVVDRGDYQKEEGE